MHHTTKYQKMTILSKLCGDLLEIHSALRILMDFTKKNYATRDFLRLACGTVNFPFGDNVR